MLQPPGGLPYADYTLDATLTHESDTVAISYPTVTVVNGLAQWDSGNGQYGGGSANVGAEGSQLPLEGSVDDFNLNTRYIPSRIGGQMIMAVTSLRYL